MTTKEMVELALIILLIAVVFLVVGCWVAGVRWKEDE